MKRQQQKGFVLFLVMIFLIVMSLLGVSMYSGFIKDQSMAGNLREKQRAIDAAQANLDFVASWLQNTNNVYEGGWYTAVNCDTTTQVGNTPVICSNPLLNPVSPSNWSSSQTFTPPSTTMNVIAGGGANSYTSNPSYYLQEMMHSDTTAYYKVTSTAQGGNASAVTVLETIYEVKCSACSIGN